MSHCRSPTQHHYLRSAWHDPRSQVRVRPGGGPSRHRTPETWSSSSATARPSPARGATKNAGVRAGACRSSASAIRGARVEQLPPGVCSPSPRSHSPRYGRSAAFSLRIAAARFRPGCGTGRVHPVEPALQVQAGASAQVPRAARASAVNPPTVTDRGPVRPCAEAARTTAAATAMPATNPAGAGAAGRPAGPGASSQPPPPRPPRPPAASAALRPRRPAARGIASPEAAATADARPGRPALRAPPRRPGFRRSAPPGVLAGGGFVVRGSSARGPGCRCPACPGRFPRPVRRSRGVSLTRPVRHARRCAARHAGRP